LVAQLQVERPHSCICHQALAKIFDFRPIFFINPVFFAVLLNVLPWRSKRPIESRKISGFLSNVSICDLLSILDTRGRNRFDHRVLVLE
jgi:hypothetical protein